MSFIVLNMPIEPIETRYSIQWTEWTESIFADNHLASVTNHGGSPGLRTEPPRQGEFLNPFTTFGWKYTQLRRAVEFIMRREDSTFVVFLHDAWFPGIEVFPYLRDMRGVKIAVVGFWHAGSYETNDLLHLKGCSKWATGSEKTWFKICDAVCVGSNYHKQRILAALGESADDAQKVYVTGYPIEIPVRLSQRKRDKIVVWPHRIAEDKHPEVFDKLAREPRFKDVLFIKTLEHLPETNHKMEYYKLLGQAKVAVSTATMETFGIAMVEAARMGCWPLCPNGMSYPETMENFCLYNNYQQLVEKLEARLSLDTIYNYPWQHRFSPNYVIGNISDIIKEVGERYAPLS